MTAYDEGRGGAGRWLVRMLSRLLILVVAFVAGAVTMHVGMHAGDREHMQLLQTENTDLQSQLTQSQAALAALQSQADVGQGTQQTLQDKLAELQQQLGHTRDQLSFYEQLLPPGPAGSVTVRAFDVQPQGEFLHYRVLLTRSAQASSDPLKGRLQFIASGRQGGKIVKVELTAPQATAGSQGADAAPAADPLALDFEQYQRSSGVLQLPAGLVIQSVRVDVLEGDTVRASQDAAPATPAPTTGSKQ